jgi:quercetin dioxygenase-like cupin family protein
MKNCQICLVKTAGFICSCPCKLYLCGKECSIQSHSVYYEKTNTKTGVLFTNRLQLMSVKLGARELIPLETHPDTTQVFFVEKGLGVAEIDGLVYDLIPGVWVTIPAGKKHEIRAFDQGLELKTIYSKPEH